MLNPVHSITWLHRGCRGICIGPLMTVESPMALARHRMERILLSEAVMIVVTVAVKEG